MVTPSIVKTEIQAEGIEFVKNSEGNVPLWFWVVNGSSVGLCILACIAWFVVASTVFGADKKCNHELAVDKKKSSSDIA